MIMKDMFNAEAWGRWYEAWSLSDEEEMDASVCLDMSDCDIAGHSTHALRALCAIRWTREQYLAQGGSS